MPAPENCPNCGADVPRGAKACPACGSDETTGWSEDASVQGLGLPDDEFNYDEFVQREFGRERPAPRRVFWWIVAVVTLLALLLLFFWRG